MSIVRSLPLGFLDGGGKMGALMRSHDWSRSPLGPPKNWPDTLKATIATCLASRFPMVVWWGPDLIMLYNDAWQPILGETKHPAGLGRPGAECWPETWPIVRQQFEDALKGSASWSENLLLASDRRGFLEECYFTYSHSPLRDAEGKVVGVQTAVLETTDRVLSERRMLVLHEVFKATVEAAAQGKSLQHTCEALLGVLCKSNPDVPLAAQYISENGTLARLISSRGIDLSLLPTTINANDREPWGIAQVLRERTPSVSKHPKGSSQPLPGGAWPEPTQQVVALPLVRKGPASDLLGVILVGVNSRRRLDESYMNFLNLIAAELAGSMATVQDREGETKDLEALRRAEAALRLSEARRAQETIALKRLHDSSSRLWQIRDLREGLAEMLRASIEMMGADKGNVQIVNPRGVLTIAAQEGFDQPFLEFFKEVSVEDSSTCGRALRTGHRIIIEDIETDEESAAFRHIALAAGYRAVQSTPLMAPDGSPLGILSTHFCNAHRPSEHELRILDLYARKAAYFIERHRSDEAWRRSEERYKGIYENAGTGIYIADLAGRYQSCNPAYASMHGYTEEELCKLNMKDLVLSEDWPRHAPDIQRLMTEEIPSFKILNRCVTKGGDLLWVHKHVSLLRDAAGRPESIIGLVTDMTERKQAEIALKASQAKFEGILQIAGDAIVSIDANRRITLFNVAAERLFGYSRSEMLGQPIDLLIPVRFRTAHEQHITRFESGPDIPRRMAEQQEVAGRRKGGEEFPAEATISKVKIGGEWVYTVVLRDITERRRAEERQRALVAELDHRVKNALATVSAVVSQTRQGSRSFANFAAALDGRIRSMATTHELLSFGRWQGVSLTELIRRELAPYAARKNTEINGPHVVLKPEAGQAMAMVLHELATNAAKYGALSTKSGCVSIRWDQRSNGQASSNLMLEWQEIGGPPVVAVGKPSYGTNTIRDLIPYEFGGTVDLVLAPNGLRCRLALPSNWLSKDGEPASNASGCASSQREDA